MPQPRQSHAGTRTKARKRALDILFEADLRDADPLATLTAHVDDADPPVREFTTELVSGVQRHRDEIDTLISGSLKGGWSLSRMPRVDRNLARIAVYELLHSEVSSSVAVAECVRLGADLSTDDSADFLSGLLSTVVGQLPGSVS